MLTGHRGRNQPTRTYSPRVDVDGFWALVTASRAGLDADDPERATEEQLEALQALLTDRPDRELLAFQHRLHEQVARAGDWRLWAAGYLATGGMSDDAFDYFRLWLVLQGRDAFERVVAEPDRLAELGWDDEGAAFGVAEGLAYVVAEVLDARDVDPGEALVSVTATGEPAGEPFPEDDDEWFAATFPRLWARAGQREPLHEEPVSPAAVPVVAAQERKPIEPLPPLLAAELFERGRIHPHDRPMLAAHWLAEGRGGEALLDLASLRGHEPEVSDLWPLALAELDVTLPITNARVAMAWAAKRVVDGERDARWLVRMLWLPEFAPVDEQSDFERLVLQLDDRLGWSAPDLRSQQAVDVAIEAMARDDVAGALHALGA